MKSIPGFKGENVKMRGKRTKLLHCGCCVAVNFKQYIEEKRAKQEIRDTMGR